jgi:DNA mismatch repair ATPase MutS
MDKIVDRQICSVYSKGTFYNPSTDTYEPRYVMAIKKEANKFGVCYFDISI